MKDSDHWVVGVCPDDPLALVQGRLYPEITANCVIAWRRNIPYSQAVNKMIEEINAYDEIILGFPIWWYAPDSVITEGKIFHNVVKQQIAEWVGTL